MAGSSGMPFARVAMRHGVVSRRQLASWGVEHMRYRLRGTTDEKTTEVLRVARELITGVSAKTIERMGPEVMAAILPRVYPQMLDEVYGHQDAGRPTFIVSAAGSSPAGDSSTCATACVARPTSARPRCSAWPAS